MSTRRSEYLIQALRGRCPRCGSGGLFQTRFRLHPACPNCKLPLEQEDGWSLGAIPLNYALTCVLWVLPVAVLFLVGIFSLKSALILAGTGAVAFPFITYKFSKTLWIGIYYALLPHELEASPDKEKGTLK